MGRDGAVTIIEGMPKIRVAAFSTESAMEEKGDTDVSVSGLFGLAENRISGNVRKIAMDTDKTDKILNDRVLGVLTVVIGWVVPFSDAYNGRAEEEVNAKAIVVIPSQKIPNRKKLELA